MKQQGSALTSIMTSAVALLMVTAAAGAVHRDRGSAKKSISQIRDTLGNLLRSIDDSGRDADALFGKRQQWCDSTVQTFEAAGQAASTSLMDMQAQLTETQAEVEEAEGTVQQVKVDIEMVKHTIKQTQEMMSERQSDRRDGGSLLQTKDTAESRLLSSLLDNKQTSLASLQGELEVAEPVLAQLKANIAETKQRSSYRTETAAAAKGFVAALQDDCQAGGDRADAQAAARVAETNAIHAAVQALEAMGDAGGPGVQSDDRSEASPLSFVQMANTAQEVTADDLSDLFAADQQQSAVRTVADPAAGPAGRAQRRAPAAIATAPSFRPRIRTLLNQLKKANGVSPDSDQAAWCAKQRESSAMALKFAQDSLAQVGSELEAHADAETELASELEKLQTLSGAVEESAKTSLEQANKEKSFIQSGRKDQELATKILDQAVTILRELGVSTSSKAVDSLESAKRVLAKQMQAAANFQREAALKAKIVGERARDLAGTQETEQHNLEYARDDHAAQRAQGAENRRLCEADAKEAAAYAQKLEESCKASAAAQVGEQRSAQVRALEDSERALDGKLASPAGGGLRATAASKPRPAAQNLTPMQRAAAEMGLSID